MVAGRAFKRVSLVTLPAAILSSKSERALRHLPGRGFTAAVTLAADRQLLVVVEWYRRLCRVRYQPAGYHHEDRANQTAADPQQLVPILLHIYFLLYHSGWHQNMRALSVQPGPQAW